MRDHAYSCMRCCMFACDLDVSLQFLFRNYNVGQSKSIAAANAVRGMNPSINIDARQDRVSPQTESGTCSLLRRSFFDATEQLKIGSAHRSGHCICFLHLSFSKKAYFCRVFFQVSDMEDFTVQILYAVTNCCWCGMDVKPIVLSCSASLPE